MITKDAESKIPLHAKTATRMKVKILLSVILALSLGFNIAGIVFLCLFVDAKHDIKTLKRERKQLEYNLMMSAQAALAAREEAYAAQHSPAALSAATAQRLAERVEHRSFVSLLDGVPDEVGLQLPKAQAPGGCTLIVYFHGMGSNFMQPFVMPADVSASTAFENVDPNTCILSCNYRKESSWGNDAAVSDINQNIRHIMQEMPCKNIVLAGGSMGACTALGYAAQAPADVREKLVGIMVFQGSGDLSAVYKQTSLEAIRICMKKSFGGSPEEVPDVYRKKSLIHNIDKLPPHLRIAIVSTDADPIIPSALQFDVADKLLEKHFAVKHIRLHGDHTPPPAPAYAEAYAFVQNK